MPHQRAASSPAEEVYLLLVDKLIAEWGNVLYTAHDHQGQKSPSIPLGRFQGTDFALRVQVNPPQAVVSARLLHKPYNGKWQNTYYDRDLKIKGFTMEWWEEFTNEEILAEGSSEEFVRQEWRGILRFVKAAERKARSALKQWERDAYSKKYDRPRLARLLREEGLTSGETNV